VVGKRSSEFSHSQQTPIIFHFALLIVVRRADRASLPRTRCESRGTYAIRKFNRLATHPHTPHTTHYTRTSEGTRNGVWPPACSRADPALATSRCDAVRTTARRGLIASTAIFPVQPTAQMPAGSVHEASCAEKNQVRRDGVCVAFLQVPRRAVHCAGLEATRHRRS
jgi:hypothetical protein